MIFCGRLSSSFHKHQFEWQPFGSIALFVMDSLKQVVPYLAKFKGDNLSSASSSLLAGFPDDNEDMHGMLRSSISSINSSHLPHNGYQQRNHQHHHSTWMNNLLYLYFYQCRSCRIHKIKPPIKASTPTPRAIIIL